MGCRRWAQRLHPGLVAPAPSGSILSGSCQVGPLCLCLGANSAVQSQ